jgi:hypothetical protein
LIGAPSWGGPYRDSAHGDSSHGVNRSTIDAKYGEFATGNCAHCHETHASLEGAEPLPADGPASHALFAAGFNVARTENPYLEADNFCFYCHSDTAAPHVINRDYSTAFGGGAAEDGPQTIMESFNQLSYHNLYDIDTFLRTPSVGYSVWYAKLGNPCSACHNSHLAKRNWDSGQTGFPLQSSISKPGDSLNLWGETELMSAYFGYEAPYSFGGTLEPAGVGESDGGKTPDYATFCSSCHKSGYAIWSTALDRNLKEIKWEETEPQKDKHGAMARDGASDLREPYLTAAEFKSNFYLSCLDCHEAHGSPNIMLQRRRINGEDLEGAVTSTADMSYVCKRCHPDDLAADPVNGVANRWEYIHHTATDKPYEKTGTCADCHTGGDESPIPCGNCHGHGMDDSWAGARATLRKTF